ncbi:hypothetical protein JA33_261 [Dickeya phage vB_DsoM_JA33]|nr:hypothetical protein HOU32_gp260 [Dickeya phage vB_DsoM_JA11]AXG67635.1 hypothetical protein JA33_261 [Dickeya phage vB_DsoM_JA33]AYD80065.1 hypothetical protein JA11_260 [Dickeya phage vB_DsoM_JA11]
MDVRSHKSLGAPQVGYSFMSDHSMLCDNRFKTEAITYTNMMWHNSLDSFRTDDPNYPYVVQIWSVEPKEMSERFLAAAVILSFTDYDLSDPRTGIAVNEMALKFDLPLKPLE